MTFRKFSEQTHYPVTTCPFEGFILLPYVMIRNLILFTERTWVTDVKALKERELNHFTNHSVNHLVFKFIWLHVSCLSTRTVIVSKTLFVNTKVFVSRIPDSTKNDGQGKDILKSLLKLNDERYPSYGSCLFGFIRKVVLGI